MYGLFGGCTTLFHLFKLHPILILALALSGLASQVPSNPGPGDRYGTSGSLTQLEHKLVLEHPELANQVSQLRAHFVDLNVEPTEDQIRQVLTITDACTDVNVQDVLANPDERREAAWILYLDTVSREGSQKADMFFNKHGPLHKE